MPQSFVTSHTKEQFKRYLYILKYFIISYDKNGPSTNLPRFHNSVTNLCSLSESPCVDYVTMVSVWVGLGLGSLFGYI